MKKSAIRYFLIDEEEAERWWDSWSIKPDAPDEPEDYYDPSPDWQAYIDLRQAYIDAFHLALPGIVKAKGYLNASVNILSRCQWGEFHTLHPHGEYRYDDKLTDDDLLAAHEAGERAIELCLSARRPKQER
jgi:hypothetical protein